jgi:hypothetical protein
MTRLLRKVIDPAVAAVRAGAPKEPRDLAIAAANNWVIALDNLSGMPIWLSDALCCLATGAGYAFRALYTDGDEVVFDVRRPVLLNGIEDVATRGDLLDRSMRITLQDITEDERKTERALDAAFNAAHPRILGALLDAVSAALRNHPHVHLAELPRMADFAEWIVAAEPALSWEPGTFLNVYAKSRAAAASVEMEASPVGPAILRFMETRTEWRGMMADLHQLLTNNANLHDLTEQRSWPKLPHHFSGKLARVKPTLRTKGIAVEVQRGKQGSSVALSWLPTGDAPVTLGDAPKAKERHHFSRESMGSGDAGDAGDAPSLFRSKRLEEEKGENERGEREKLEDNRGSASPASQRHESWVHGAPRGDAHELVSVTHQNERHQQAELNSHHPPDVHGWPGDAKSGANGHSGHKPARAVDLTGFAFTADDDEVIY